MYRRSARNKKGPSQSAWDAPSTPILFPCRGTVEKGTVMIKVRDEPKRSP